MLWRICRAALLAITMSTLIGCDSALYTNLTEREANQIVATLLNSGVGAQRRVQDDGQVTVTVPDDRLAEAVSLLEEAGLPEHKFSNIGDVFKGNGLVSSPVQERAQMVYALSEELAHTVSQIDGVLSARVHVVLPDNDLLKRVISPSSASVLIRYESNVDVAQLIPQIKTLVANSISGLSYEGVSVTAIKAMTHRQNETPALRSFLGMWIVDASVGRARLMFIGGLVIIFALAGTLAWYWRREHNISRSFALERS